MYNSGSYFSQPLPSSPPPTQAYMQPAPQSRLPSLYYSSSTTSGSSTFSSSPPRATSPFISHPSFASYPHNENAYHRYDKHHPPPSLHIPPFHRQKAFFGTNPHQHAHITSHVAQKHVVSHEYYASSVASSPTRRVQKENSGRTLKRRHKQKYGQKRKKIVVMCDKLNGYRLHPEFEMRYLLGDELGSGGFGFVMSATRYADSQEVAVKFIYRKKIPRHSWVQDAVHGPVPTELYILLRTMQSPHPNIIRLIDYFADNEFFILVTELHGTPWSRNPRPQQQKRQPLANLPVSQVQNVGMAFAQTTSSDTEIDESEPDASMEDDSTDYDEDSYNSADDPDYMPTNSDEMDESADEQEIEIEEEIRYASKRESHDLFEMIETRRNLTERQIRYMMRQLVDALWYLDSLNIYHRDIKDENVLVDDTLTIKLIDFGSAIVLPSSPPNTPTTPTTPRTQFSRFYGTLQYAPVEVLKSLPYDAEKCDVWALGILLFTCLTGQTPFRSADDAISKEWDLRRTVSDECREFLGKCLEKDPGRRATIGQLAIERWWLVDLP
ncbi:kinase-like domain-containing protein [Lipomyces orientalis]|uniref:Kinase-like domain-containing protein n=1 Tax=Lipomyces orientalis TaxID=1233043 RepID=A0ACC3TQ92_9ASCO